MKPNPFKKRNIRGSFSTFFFSMIFLCCFLVIPQAWSQKSGSNKTWAAKKAKQIQKKNGYQETLPKNEEVSRPPENSMCEGEPSALPRAPACGLHSGCASGGMYLMITIFLVLLGYFVMQMVQKNSPSAVSGFEEDMNGSHEIFGIEIKKDMSLDELLLQGDFEGAICFLLFQALRKTGWKPEGRGKSKTARELLAQIAQNAGYTISLSQLVRLAELVRFSSLEADRGHFDRARALFQEFEQQLRTSEENDG